MSLRANSFRLRELRERIKPFRLHFFPWIGSTNDHAVALRKRGDLFAPAIVLTGNQTAGRGRGSNTWWSGRGSLTVTFVLAADERIEPHQLPLLAGLAVRNAAAELTKGADVQLKWPNDVLYEDKKLAGLLCERVRGADLVGVGLNVNIERKRIPRSLRGRIVSLSQICGRTLDMTHTLSIVAGHLRAMLRQATEHPFATILHEYDSHHALIGRRICVTVSPEEPPLCGRCEGLDRVGRLLVRAGGKGHTVISGTVQTQ